MWGMPHEEQYLQALGIPHDAVVAFDPTVAYCADQVIVPASFPVMTPPPEALGLALESLGAPMVSE